MFRTLGSNSSTTFLSAMTLAAVARDSAAAVVVEEGWAAWDSTWDILAMAEEATILWKFDEAIVVGND